MKVVDRLQEDVEALLRCKPSDSRENNFSWDALAGKAGAASGESSYLLIADEIGNELNPRVRERNPLRENFVSARTGKYARRQPRLNETHQGAVMQAPHRRAGNCGVLDPSDYGTACDGSCEPGEISSAALQACDDYVGRAGMGNQTHEQTGDGPAAVAAIDAEYREIIRNIRQQGAAALQQKQGRLKDDRGRAGAKDLK